MVVVVLVSQSVSYYNSIYAHIYDGHSFEKQQLPLEMSLNSGHPKPVFKLHTNIYYSRLQDIGFFHLIIYIYIYLYLQVDAIYRIENTFMIW